MFRPYRNYRLFRRYRQILLALARAGYPEIVRRLSPFAFLRLRKRPPNGAVPEAVPRAVRFRRMLEQLGPTFIKLGQILSTRADLLPHDIVLELAQLQDHVTPTPWDAMKKGLPSSLVADLATALAEFDPQPLASASIAQVYRARLQTGQPVAVKIIRPGTERLFQDDLLILEDLAGRALAHFDLARHWDVPKIVEELRTSIHHELDLLHEGRNTEIFRTNFAHDPRIHVPQVFWEYTNRQMLVMEFIDGRPLAEFFDPTNAGADAETRRTLARHGADIVLKQIFEHGFFQADPHPGNALVLPGNVLCFLDFGMCGRLDRQALDILARVLHAVVHKDIDRLFKAAADLDVLPDEHRPELRLAILDLVEQYHGLPLKQIDLRQVLREVLRLVSHFRLGVRHDFLFLIKALGAIEGTGRRLDGDFDMLEHVRPYVRRLVLRRFAPLHLADTAQRTAEDLLRLALEAPDHLLEILRRARSGRLALEFRHRGLEPSLTQLNQMSDKIVLGLIVGALIIASSLMAHAHIGPMLLGIPMIGGAAFVIAGVTGLWISFDILRNRRR